MANEYAQFLTPWVIQEENGEQVRTPQLPRDHSGITKWQDITGQLSENLIPDPNGYLIECWADTATMDAVEADPQFVVIRETRRNLDEVPDPPPDPDNPPPPPPSEVPSQADFDAFRLGVEQVFNPILDARVWTSNQINDAVGATVDGRSWEQINNELLAYCKTAPKGGETMQIQPVDLGSGNVGWQPGSGELQPNTVFQVPVARVASNETLGGIFALDLDPTLDIQQGFILGIEVAGEIGFRVTDAFWNDTNKQWVWFNTGFHFVPDQQYSMVIYR